MNIKEPAMPHRIYSATGRLLSRRTLLATVVLGFSLSPLSHAAELTGSSQKKSPEKPKVVSPEQATMMKQQEEMIRQSKQMLEMMQKNPAFNPASGKPAMPQLSPELAAYAAASSGLPKRDEAAITWARSRNLSANTMQSYLNSLTMAVDKKLAPEKRQRADELLSKQEKVISSSNATAALATACWITKNYQAAVYLMGKAAKASPQDPDHLNNYAAFLTMTGGGHAAVPILNHLNTKYPKNSTVLNNLGQAWLSIGEIEEAEKKLKEAVGIARHHSQANHSLSYIQEARNDRAAALQSMKNSIKKAFSNAKQNRIRQLGGKLTNKDLDWTLPMPEDALGLSQFTYPEYIDSSAIQPELGPQWKAHEEQLVKAAEVFGKLGGPLLQQSMKEHFEEVEYARQFHKSKNPALWLKQKAELKIKLMQEDRSDYEKNQKTHLETRFKQIIKELARLEKIYTSAANKMFKAADNVPVAGGGDVDCGQVIKLADAYLKESKEIIGNYNNEWLAWLRRTTNDEAYFAKFTKTDTDFELTKSQLKMRYLFSIGQMLHPYDNSNAYQCVTPNYIKFPHGKLADFYDLNCKETDTYSVPGFGTITTKCNKIIGDFELSIKGVGIKASYSENLDTDEMIAFSSQLGYSKSFDIGSLGGKKGTDWADKGPLSVEATVKAGGFIEFDNKGMTDIGIQGELSVSAKTTPYHDKDSAGKEDVPTLESVNTDFLRDIKTDDGQQMIERHNEVKIGVEGRWAWHSGYVRGTGALKGVSIYESKPE